jgi:hypothetical protein
MKRLKADVKFKDGNLKEFYNIGLYDCKLNRKYIKKILESHFRLNKRKQPIFYKFESKTFKYDNLVKSETYFYMYKRSIDDFFLVNKITLRYDD